MRRLTSGQIWGKAWRRLRGGSLSPVRAAFSMALGVFIGCLPLYGLHLALCLLLCVPLRLDTLLAYLAANISNPFVAPFLIVGEIEVGSYLLTGHFVGFSVEEARQVGVGGFFAQALLGSVVVGATLAPVMGGIAFVVARFISSRLGGGTQLSEGIARTIERYRGAPQKDRSYVTIKLLTDPATERLSKLGSLGRVTDAGCGRGQFGLLLQELGLLETLTGFDMDARKVEVAKRAADGRATFAPSDLAEATWPEADTVLLVDVLHYVPLEEQRAALRAAADSLTPGGRLIVREVDKKPSVMSQLTRLLEKIGTKSGYNKVRKLSFTSRGELVAAIEQAGLQCSRVEALRGLANDLIVAQKPE